MLIISYFLTFCMFGNILASTCAAVVLTFFFGCRADRNAFVVLHTDMGDIRVRLFDDTPLHRDNLLALAENPNLDTLPVYRVERDFLIQFGEQPLNPDGHDVGVEAEIGALPVGGALAAVAAEPGKLSDGTDFFIVLDRAQTDASLDEMEKKLGLKLQPAERQAYKTRGGLPQWQGRATVFGEVVQGMEVAQRIAAVPRDSAARPLQARRVWMVVVR